jgi:transcriptional regulator with XRE-family HTH domain
MRTNRRARGWTVRHVAELVGVSHVSIVQWEHDRWKPRPLARARLDALGLTNDNGAAIADDPANSTR